MKILSNLSVTHNLAIFSLMTRLPGLSGKGYLYLDSSRGFVYSETATGDD
jgi:hypothetical protein